MRNFLKTLGPGILFASTAIGVSHLIQSTQAGGNFGFTMLWAVILANLFKYPFFEFAARYANATGESIITGYNKLGKVPILLFFIITLISMFLVTSAVGNVTAGFMQNLFGIKSTMLSVIVVFLICAGILIAGKYNILDSLMKVIGIVLLISTLIAFFMVLTKGPQGNQPLMDTSGLDMPAYFAFLIPLMGWMPTAVDLSTWSSLWTVERIKQTGYHPKLKETLLDFNLGYIASALLAICFVTLGAFIMFGTGKTFAPGGAAFAGDVIGLYTETFGQWANMIISASAFSIMFGTCIAVFDGYSRAMTETIHILKADKAEERNSPVLYRVVLIVLSIGSFFLIYAYQEDKDGFRQLVNLATSISFLLAPIVAVFNLILVREKYVGASHKPKLWLSLLAYIGLAFLVIFTILFLFKDSIISLLTNQ